MELKFEESATSAGKNCINSNQIKSATDNNGEFSNENDSILFSLADDKQWQTMDANDTAPAEVVGLLREGLLGKKMGDLSPEIQNRILRTLPKAKISILQNDSGQTIVLAGNSEAMDVALEFVKRDTIYNKTTGNAGVITRTTQDKIASDKALYKTRGNGFEDYCQFTAGANLKYLYENAELTEDRDDRNNDPTIERVRIYSVAVDFGEGDIGVVEILAKKIKGIDRLYTLEVNQIRKATPKVWDKVISLVPAGSSSDGSKATPQSNSNVSSGTSSVKVNKLYSLSPEAQRQYDEVVAKYKGTDQWLKAPNGKDTNLTERQWVLVRTQNFLDWFGDWINDPENAYTFNGQTYSAYADAENAARVNEEKFVQDFMQYLRDGSAPNTEIATFFGQLKDFLRRFIDQFKDRLPDDYSEEEGIDEEGNPLWSLATDEQIEKLKEKYSSAIRDKNAWRGGSVAEFYKLNKEVVLDLLAEYPTIEINGLSVIAGINSQGDMFFTKEYLSGQLYQEITGEKIKLLPRYTSSILNNVFGIKLNTGSTGDAFYLVDEDWRLIDFKLASDRQIIKELNSVFKISDTAFYVVKSGFDASKFASSRVNKIQMAEDQNAIIVDLEKGRAYEVKKNGADSGTIIPVAPHSPKNGTERVLGSGSYNPSLSSSEYFNALKTVNENEQYNFKTYQQHSDGRMYSLTPEAQRQYDDVVAKYKGTD